VAGNSQFFHFFQGKSEPFLNYFPAFSPVASIRMKSLSKPAPCPAVTIPRAVLFHRRHPQKFLFFQLRFPRYVHDAFFHTEIKNTYIVDLAEAVDSSDALFQTEGIPGRS